MRLVALAIVMLAALVACATDNTLAGVPDVASPDAVDASAMPDGATEGGDVASDAVAASDAAPEAAVDAAMDSGCVDHAERTSSGACRCVAGYSLCAERCVDLYNDNANCGACGAVCDGGICALGRCVTVAPPVDASADVTDASACASMTPGNCCGVSCNTPRAVGACMAGRCSIASCETGFANCDGIATNGCEVDVTSSAANCGACRAPCASGRVCRDGACVTPCTGSFADCNGNTGDGCEVNLAGDAANCGACGMRCGAGQTCSVGRCR